MKIDKILILGSTLLAEKVVDKLSNYYDLVGYVPSIDPTIEGKIKLPPKTIDASCDIKISLQYNKIIKNPKNIFNLHTGLLPKYGGVNILSHTIKNKEKEQGLTFHKMGNKLDYGPIISKISYPVLSEDSVEDLYKRQLLLAPDFLLSCLELLKNINEKQIDNCLKEKPILYKREEFKWEDGKKELQNLK